MDFFEGAEKRLMIELINSVDFDKSNVDAWKQLLKDIKCTILSTVSNDYYLMFLLSESVMLIHDNFILLKTCGSTAPLNLLKYFSSKIKNIEFSHPILLEPDLQPDPHKNFSDELDFIRNNVTLEKENNLQFVQKLHVNYTCNNVVNAMYEMTLWNFNWDNGVVSEIKKNMKNWKIDEFFFKPHGYSMNALKGNKYITIHVTPNKSCSYLSFETNKKSKLKIMDKLIKHLDPRQIGYLSNCESHNIKINKDHTTYEQQFVYIKHYS